MSFFIVSGLSGSGKTIALQALEDIGFYCIDNLPAVLLPHFSGLLADMRNNAIMNVAIGLDVRNRAFLADLPRISVNFVRAASTTASSFWRPRTPSSSSASKRRGASIRCSIIRPRWSKR